MIGLWGLLVVALSVAAWLAQAYGRLWLQAYMSGAEVSLTSLIGMSFRQVPSKLIVNAKIALAKAGIDVGFGKGTAALEAQYLAGGNLEHVVQAVIIASRAGIPLDFDRAAAVDLAGRDVLQAVQTSISPRVINCPDPTHSKRDSINAVAKDGIELRIQACVTVRTNLDLLIGGATEDTIVARVGQGIVSAVGSAADHAEVLSRPDEISKLLIRQGFDANSAFSIVSIDIARIDVGENIGARIAIDQAQADMRESQSLSEGRRANAVARKREMLALVRQKRAELVLAESLVPYAVAAAIGSGELGETKEISPVAYGGLASNFFRDSFAAGC